MCIHLFTYSIWEYLIWLQVSTSSYIFLQNSIICLIVKGWHLVFLSFDHVLLMCQIKQLLMCHTCFLINPLHFLLRLWCPNPFSSIFGGVPTPLFGNFYEPFYVNLKATTNGLLSMITFFSWLVACFEWAFHFPRFGLGSFLPSSFNVPLNLRLNVHLTVLFLVWYAWQSPNKWSKLLNVVCFEWQCEVFLLNNLF